MRSSTSAGAALQHLLAFVEMRSQDPQLVGQLRTLRRRRERAGRGDEINATERAVLCILRRVWRGTEPIESAREALQRGLKG